MAKTRLMFLLVMLIPFTVQSSTFSKNLTSTVVKWDDCSAYSPTENERYILSSFSGNDTVITGKIIKIDTFFPPHNAQPMGLVTIHVYEGDTPGAQVKFMTHNVFFTCEKDTPYPYCRQNDKHIGELISVQSDDHPWVLPGDTVMVILRPYGTQFEQIEGETKELVYVRFIKEEFDKDSDQTTYGQKLNSWDQTFNNPEYLKTGKGKTPYEFLNLTRQKDRKVSEIKKVMNLAD